MPRSKSLPLWKSPLKKGNIVVCEGGLVVEILRRPGWIAGRYEVPGLVLRGDDYYTAGHRTSFFHRGKDQFPGISIFKKIFKSRKEWGPDESLEEEFFKRKQKHA